MHVTIRVTLLVSCLTACGGWDRRDCYTAGERCEPTTRPERGAPGPAGKDGAAGKKGKEGKKGETGTAGAPGTSALLEVIEDAPGCPAGGITLLLAQDLNANGIIDIGIDTIQSAEVCDGADGQDGADGAPGMDAPPTPFSPVGLVDPCGDAPGKVDEVFIRLSNGLLLASFSDDIGGTNTRFANLGQGSYMTTDGSNCFFSVDSAYQLYNEHY